MFPHFFVEPKSRESNRFHPLRLFCFFLEGKTTAGSSSAPSETSGVLGSFDERFFGAALDSRAFARALPLALALGAGISFGAGFSLGLAFTAEADAFA